MKDRFVAIVSHDLKNPLNSLGLSLSMVAETLEGRLEGEAREDVGFSLDVAQKSVKRLVRLADDLVNAGDGLQARARGVNRVGNAIKFSPKGGTACLRVEADATVLGGTGLGLAIARAIVARHGGRIRAESAWGEGATFKVELPVRAPVKG